MIAVPRANPDPRTFVSSTADHAPARLPQPRWGLRLKTAAVLVVLAAITLLLALGVGRWAVDGIRGSLGEAFARNHTLLTQQRILAVIGRDLALSQRLAQSPLVREWLLDEDDPARRRRMIREAAAFRDGFTSRSYFLISALSLNYYFGEDGSRGRPVLRYTLDPDNPADAWFFATLETVEDYGINVNLDQQLEITNVWLNVLVRDEAGRPIGLAGTGFELSRFLQAFVSGTEPGVTTLLIDREGAIMAHPDPRLIEFASVTRERSEKTLFRLLDDERSQRAVETLMREARADPLQAWTGMVELDGQTQLVALSHLPELDWFVVTALDLSVRRALDQRLIASASLGGGGLILLLLLTSTLGVDRLVLAPLARLTESVRAMARGRYDVRLAADRQDELGELYRAFDAMARQVRHHTEHLEQRVAERTAELGEANARIAEAHRQLTDSIDYARLIQGTLLPDHALADRLPGEHFVLWRPRDTVGGDFYLYRPDACGHLLGIVDCAGHGVPGAIMTMIAHAALEMAIANDGPGDPAALLHSADCAARGMLPGGEGRDRIATSIDMGLCYVDAAERALCFSGARVALFWSDGDDCHEVAGHRRGLNDRRRGRYTNTRLALLPGRTFYLVTDGLFDQAGGEHGYGFGARRFKSWVRVHAREALDAQRAALDDALTAYQCEYPQRDDITVLAFRFGCS